MGADGYLAAYYYQGEFDASAIFEFALDGIWRLLTYHLPEAVALAAIPVFTFLLVAVFLRKLPAKIPDRAIAVIFLLCIAVSAGAALLGIYPLGDIRQVIYLGPIIFLAAGVAVHATAANLAGLLRRTWLIPALAIAAAGAIALAGVSDIRLDSPYQTRENTKAVISFLEERIAEDDFVFVTNTAIPVMRFYLDAKPYNYFYSKVGCRGTYEPCNREMVNVVDSLPNVPNKVFLVYQPRSIRTAPPDDAGIVDANEAQWRREGVKFTAYLVNDEAHRANDKPASHWRWQRADAAPGAANTPDDAAWTDIAGARQPWYTPTGADTGKFLRARVSYEKNGTTHRAQTEAISPLVGFGRLGEQVSVEHIYGSGRHNVFLIANGNAIKESVVATARADYERFVSGEPVVRATFDVYLSKNTLAYAKSPCVPADTEAVFFLHLIPDDVNDLPDDRKQHGFDNRDFRFDNDGRSMTSRLFDGKCLARVPLPEYGISKIRTGQYVLVDDSFNNLWETEFPFAPGQEETSLHSE